MIQKSLAPACAILVLGLLISPVEAGAKAGAVAPAFSPGFARAPMVRPAVHAPTHVPASIIRGPVGAPRQVPPPPRITGSMGVRAVGLRRAGDTLRAPRHALRPFGLGLPGVWYSPYYEPSGNLIVVAPNGLDGDADPADLRRAIPAVIERPRACRSESVTVPSESGGRRTVNIVRC